MDKSTYDTLKSKGFEPEQPLQKKKMVSVKEMGKKYLLNLKSQYSTVVFQVDGNIIKKGNKCDKLILVNTKSTPVEEWTQIFVELKGTDSLHGMEQLYNTVTNALFESTTNKVRKARLVATSIPSYRANPKIEKLRKSFKKLGIEYRTIKPCTNQRQADNL